MIRDQGMHATFLYALLSQCDKQELFGALQLMPAEISIKIRSLRQPQDQYRGIIGKMLLEKALTKYTDGMISLSDIKYSKFHRPYVEGDVDFNISHSDDFVCCVISKGIHVGVDVERITAIDPTEFEEVFTTNERRYIYSSTDIISTFFELWTKKEAVMKASGQGFLMPAYDVKIENDLAYIQKRSWFLYNLEVSKEYRIAIACNAKVDAINVVHCKF